MVQSPSRPISLDEFLSLPETEPASEYVDGQIRQKPMPQGKHSTLQFELAAAINQQAKTQKLADALPELCCTFGDRSLVPDIAVVRWENLPRDAEGEIADRFTRSPDWVIEILSPEQPATLMMEKIIFCVNAGTELGWLVDPFAKAIAVFFQHSLPKVYLAIETPQEPLTVIERLESWQITASNIFDWLKV